MSDATNKETENRSELERALAGAFDTYREIPLRHALFRRRILRIDLLAIPKDECFRDLVLGFEVKGHDAWNIPLLAQAIQQADDYVLATIEPGTIPAKYDHKRVMAVFVYPSLNLDGAAELRQNLRAMPLPALDPLLKLEFLRGMVHTAGYRRVGVAARTSGRRQNPLSLRCPNEVWIQDRGWRADARNILAGKRQIGSQRLGVLDELQAMERAAAP